MTTNAGLLQTEVRSSYRLRPDVAAYRQPDGRLRSLNARLQSPQLKLPDPVEVSLQIISLSYDHLNGVKNGTLKTGKRDRDVVSPRRNISNEELAISAGHGAEFHSGGRPRYRERVQPSARFLRAVIAGRCTGFPPR